MKRGAFARLAGRMWDEIPAIARQGVEALTVEDRTLPHPDFEEVYTLGECVTEDWPSGFGGEGDTRSVLVLYYGSFVALSELDSGFDWQGELWETILHELLHHREAAAGESGLDDFDWAAEQNFRRLAGEPFDPGFIRAVPPGPDGVVRLDSESFLETEVAEGASEARFTWRGREYGVDIPEDVPLAFVEIANLAGGRLCIVARRKRPWWRLGGGGRNASPPAELRRDALPFGGNGAG